MSQYACHVTTRSYAAHDTKIYSRDQAIWKQAVNGTYRTNFDWEHQSPNGRDHLSSSSWWGQELAPLHSQLSSRGHLPFGPE